MKREKPYFNTFELSMLVVFIFTSNIDSCFGHSSDSLKPEIGKPMPDFQLNYVTHFDRRQVSLADFKGKWLFLDFWFTGCATCVQSFPKVNEIHNEFKDNLVWMMVGLNDKRYNKNTEAFYEKIRIKRNLQMPVAYDSLLAKQWDIHAMPYIIIIDPQGVVRFITDGRNITTKAIKKLVSGEEVSFYNSTVEYEEPKADVDMNKNLLIYSSTISNWNGERQAWIEIERWAKWPKEELEKGYRLSMTPLIALYFYAYVGRFKWLAEHDSLFGKVHPKPILEVSDSTDFEYSFGTNENGKIYGMYNYHLLLPTIEVKPENVTRLMREDLKRVFKYNVSVETREMPVWKLISKPGAVDKIKTKESSKFATPGSHAVGFTMTNMPPKYFVACISFYLNRDDTPFIDETGLKDNFDFTLQADMTNIDDVRRAIQKQGFDLVKGTKKLKVLVIRDQK